MMRLPATVVFDLDGTLVDTAPDLCAALNHALSVLGRPGVPAEDVRHMVGHGARKLLERGLAASGDVSPELVEAGVPPFMDYYRAHIADGSQPYPGVEAALDELTTAGCTLAICTNKPAALSAALIAALGWDGRFAANIGFDSVPAPKPDPGHLLATIAAVGGDPGGCSVCRRFDHRHDDRPVGGGTVHRGKLRVLRSSGGRPGSRCSHRSL